MVGTRNTLSFNGCLIAAAMALLAGCATTRQPLSREEEFARLEQELAAKADEQRRLFEAEPPHKVGIVEMGPQLPLVSPDGQSLLYLRVDLARVVPDTLLGSPEHTSGEGSLTIWLRPLHGSEPGRQLSSRRWCHSPAWAADGRAVAYVANEPPYSVIVHHDLETAAETAMGLPGAINCQPQFDGDARTLLFCAGEKPKGPFRIYRQVAGESRAVVFTPRETDCMFPIKTTAADTVLCAQVGDQELTWALCTPRRVAALARQHTGVPRSLLPQILEGVRHPLSPDGRHFLFCEIVQTQPFEGQIGVCRIDDGSTTRPGKNAEDFRTIAACWIDHQHAAVATPQHSFVWNVETLIRVPVLNGSWIPVRYIPAARKLILFGREMGQRLSIWEVGFRVRQQAEPTE